MYTFCTKIEFQINIVEGDGWKMFYIHLNKHIMTERKVVAGLD